METMNAYYFPYSTKKFIQMHINIHFHTWIKRKKMVSYNLLFICGSVLDYPMSYIILRLHNATHEIIEALLLIVP